MKNVFIDELTGYFYYEICGVRLLYKEHEHDDWIKVADPDYNPEDWG